MNLYLELEPKTSKDRPYSKPSVFTEEGKSILWVSYPFLGIAVKASPPQKAILFSTAAPCTILAGARSCVLNDLSSAPCVFRVTGPPVTTLFQSSKGLFRLSVGG